LYHTVKVALTMMDISLAQIESIGKVGATLFGLGVAAYKGFQGWQNLRFRANLKRDIELMKSLEGASLAGAAKTVRANINRSIKALYAPRQSILMRLPPYAASIKQGAGTLMGRVLGAIPRPADSGMFTAGIIMSIIFLPLFFLINTEANTQAFSWSWWSVIPGFFALGGVSLLVSSFDEEQYARRRVKDGTASLRPNDLAPASAEPDVTTKAQDSSLPPPKP